MGVQGVCGFLQPHHGCRRRGNSVGFDHLGRDASAWLWDLSWERGGGSTSSEKAVGAKVCGHRGRCHDWSQVLGRWKMASKSEGLGGATVIVISRSRATVLVLP